MEYCNAMRPSVVGSPSYTEYRRTKRVYGNAEGSRPAIMDDDGFANSRVVYTG